MELSTGTITANLERIGEGLRTMRGNFQDAGFQEAVVSYRQMKQVLLQQRLLSLSSQDPKLREQWQAVHRETEEIAGLLQPFLSVMEEIGRVAAMNSISEQPEEAAGSGA
ncbi:hypothetical protein D3P07_24020 [Paenibacillus sp. 1011MAR3C5]|uniref:hypothetical protein n=1 Tax=Paenibacillus sp. 1011MAR3C5 TaxID=1675787 RepID=UPI000E6BF952|nr:hypothetical protein [Paenibacillus sp. 1011MAR3C5]RJE83882.1 hypothetical protein D3P07_24020 [Paenibacillus sp. 1011MAR3C5]